MDNQHLLATPLLAFAALSTSGIAQTLYVDPTSSVAVQSALEQSFLQATRAPALIDLDDVSTGAVLGDEWLGRGLRLSQPGGSGLAVFVQNSNFVPRSAPHALFPGTATSDDRIFMHLDPPQNVVGFWIIDAEVDNAGENIEFFSANGLVASIPMPVFGTFTGSADANYFIGIDSPIPIVEVRINDLTADNNEATGLDDVRLGRALIGTSYCAPAVSNSSGAPARMQVIGRTEALVNDIVLRATDMPASTFGYFLASRTQGNVPGAGGSQGRLCLGGSVARFVGQIGNSGTARAIEARIDLTLVPEPPTFQTTVQSGDSWSFQCWFRDANPMVTSNFTDAVTVVFL